MIIKALNTFHSVLDLSAMERLQEGNPCEQYPFRLFMRPGDIVTVDDKFYNLIRIQDALKLGYIEIGNIPGTPIINTTMVNFSYNGSTMAQIAGEDLKRGDVVYYRDDGKVYRAKANSLDTMICIGMATADVKVNGQAILLIEGLIRNSSVFNFTVGGQTSQNKAIVWVSNFFYGGVTQLRPNRTGHIVQIIGYAVATDILNFKPDYTYIELADIPSSSSESSSSSSSFGYSESSSSSSGSIDI